MVHSVAHGTSSAAIAPSLRVGLESVQDPLLCPTPGDLPRRRTHGFDIDGTHGTVAFFGACRPSEAGVTRAAVSYRTWTEASNAD